MEDLSKVKALRMDMVGHRIALYPIKIETKDKIKSSIVQKDNSILDPKSLKRFALGARKELEDEAVTLYEQMKTHPFKAVVVAIGVEAEKAGFKVGDIVYTSEILAFTRDAVWNEGLVYPVIGWSSVMSIVDHVELKESIKLNVH